MEPTSEPEAPPTEQTPDVEPKPKSHERGMYAALIFAGLVSTHGSSFNAEGGAAIAVSMADALLAELEK